MPKENSVPVKLLWFAILWFAGVTAVGIVGLAIKLVLSP